MQACFPACGKILHLQQHPRIPAFALNRCVGRSALAPLQHVLSLAGTMVASRRRIPESFLQRTLMCPHSVVRWRVEIEVGRYGPEWRVAGRFSRHPAENFKHRLRLSYILVR